MKFTGGRSIHAGEQVEQGRSGAVARANTHTHTHTRLSSAETLEARALMAADVGLLGGALSGPEFPMAATQAPFNPPASLIGSPLPGSSTAAGLMLGASAGPQGFLPAVSFGGVVSGTLAIQTNTTGGSHAAFAASLASALENEVSGKPGEVSGSAPASPTEPPVSDGSPAAPAPDSQRQGNYRPQWVLPPSKPMAPTGTPPWASSGPSADEEEAMDLGGVDQEARREIEDLIASATFLL